jgi:nitrite reductase/ring-hydroxylating ferredoxin subunit
MNEHLSIDDIAVGTMKMIKVDGHRVCLVRTATGLHAIDHACPHEGYGLTQGELDGDLLTCAPGTTGSSGCPTAPASRARNRSGPIP